MATPIELLTPDEFEAIARKAQRKHLTLQTQKKLRTLSVKPTHVFSDHYLPELANLVPLSGIVALNTNSQNKDYR